MPTAFYACKGNAKVGLSALNWSQDYFPRAHEQISAIK